MNKRLCFLVLIIVTCYSCSANKNIKNEILDKIDVSIEQGGNNINIIDDTAEIRRSKFSIKFKFAQPEDSILINASFRNETFNNAKEGLPLDELSGFKNTGIAEELFNKNSVLYLSFDSPNFWYYADDTDHRFNNVLKNESGYVFTRDISGIVDLDGTGEKIDISKVKQNAIFLVIIKIEVNEDYTRMIEKSRKLLKLKFIL